MFIKHEVYNLDWPPIVVEGYSKTVNEATLVFNLDATDDCKRLNVVRYVVGRTVFCYINIPSGSWITLWFDFRGQKIVESDVKKLKDVISNKLKQLCIDKRIHLKSII